VATNHVDGDGRPVATLVIAPTATWQAETAPHRPECIVLGFQFSLIAGWWAGLLDRSPQIRPTTLRCAW